MGFSSQTLAKISFVALATLIIGAGIFFQFYNPNRITSLPDYGEVADFTLPSIDGEDFVFSSTTGKVRLVTFIYTKCNMGCATVSTKMAEMYASLKEKGYKDDVHLVTIDFDYRFDTMDNLTLYASYYRQSGDNWDFLLGDENQTLEVTNAWNFYFELDNSTMQMNSTMTDMDNMNSTESAHMGHSVVYIHPFVVYLVDQSNHLRNYFLGLTWDIERGVEMVEFLLNE